MSAARSIALSPATTEDAEAIAALRNAVSDDLTFRHGKGPWTVHCTTAAVLRDLRDAKLYVVLRRDEVIASLALTKQKPWAAAPTGFTPALKPLYLTGLVVAPEFQRRGYGHACVDQAFKLAKRAKAGAVLASVFAHRDVTVGKFFERCGFTEIGGASDRGVPSLYFEKTLAS